jgi:hypothetical protein
MVVNTRTPGAQSDGVTSTPSPSEKKEADSFKHSVNKNTIIGTSNPPHRTSHQIAKESAEIAGNVVLLTRGGCGFVDKVKWAQRRGAVAVIVGDNILGGPLVTMFAKGDTSNITIPSLFTSHTTAHLLSSLMPSGGGVVGAHDPTSDNEPKEWRNNKPDKIVDEEVESDVNTSATSSSPGFLANILSALGLLNREPLAPSAVKKKPAINDKWRGQHKTGPYATRLSYGGTHKHPGYLNRPKPVAQAAPIHHDGLWVTLTPTDMTSSPFFDTILVLVISPLVTLTVVYVMLLIRSRIRRRRWRAPKSVVDRLPVRTYHTIESSGAPSTAPATPMASSPSTPLLQHMTTELPSPAMQYSTISLRPPPTRSRSSSMRRSSRVGEVPDASARGGSVDGGDAVSETESERREKGLAAWRRKYGGRQKECVVCLEDYVDGVSRVMSLPCGHEFHVECM